MTKKEIQTVVKVPLTDTDVKLIQEMGRVFHLSDGSMLEMLAFTGWSKIYGVLMAEILKNEVEKNALIHKVEELEECVKNYSNFTEEVEKMRFLEKTYLRYRAETYLFDAKEQEKRVDALIKTIKK